MGTFWSTRTGGRSARVRLALIVSATLAGLAWTITAEGIGTTARVSLSSSGGEIGCCGANSYYYTSGDACSADGRYVLFMSDDAYVVPGVGFGQWDLFVRDRVSGTTELVALTSGGSRAMEAVYAGGISADGRYVCFSTNENNVVPGDANGTSDVFVKDRVTGSIERVSLTNLSYVFSGSSRGSISDDGRYVAFSSMASDLASPDTNLRQDVFVYDRVSHTTTMASIAENGGQMADHSYTPCISGDGSRVVFVNYLDPEGRGEILVRDLYSGTTTRVCETSSTYEHPIGYDEPVISGDGRFVAFSSNLENLVEGDTNGRMDVFVKDLQTSTFERVSVSTVGSESPLGAGGHCTISADGRFVGFTSGSDSLVPGDTNGVADAFVRDRVAGTTERVSLAADGSQPDGYSVPSWLSADGRLVLFDSDATNIVLGDTNGSQDVFMRDRAYEPPPPAPAPAPEPAPAPAPVITLPKASLLTRPYSATYTRYYNRGFAVYGYLKPRHTSGLTSVKLLCDHYESGKWVRRVTVYAKNTNYSTYTKYVRTLALNRRGKWRVRAYHADSRHAPTYSSASYITVR